MPRNFDDPTRGLRFPSLFRLRLRQISFARIFRGGRVADGGRLPRYALIFLLGVLALWVPILSYLSTAPLRFRSEMSLILPGSGASASINLDSIGQASSSANSPYSNSSISPTETYKRLIGAERILDAAALTLGMETREFGKPRVELVDQTGLIHVSITGGSAENAKARGDALLTAFFREIEALRADEVKMRETGTDDSIDQYRRSAIETREKIKRLQRESGLISPAQYEALVVETDGLAERVRDLTATLSEKTEAVRVLQVALGVSPKLASAALKLHADTEFAALVDSVSEQSATLSLARSRYGERHPEVRAARDSQVAARDETLSRARLLTGLDVADLKALDISHVGNRTELLSDLVRLDSERAGLAAELETLTDRLEIAETRRIALIEPAAQLEDLQRDFAVAEAVFASTMARTETSKADLFASYPLVQVLEDPSLPRAPSSPNRKLAIAAGIAATLFLAIGLGLSWLRRPLIDRLLVSPSQAAPVSSLVVPAE